MIITVREIAREDLRHLYCTDPRLKREVARRTRRGQRSPESTATRRDLDTAGTDVQRPSQPAA